MLVELRVENFGIIERVDWRPGGGLNVVTGETGAGKSMVIDALETLLSGQADENEVRHGTDEALIEAVFDIVPAENGLKQLLDESGLREPGEDLLVVSGNIRRRGRSTFRINGRAVNRSLLRRIGGLLVDIHGQSQHLSLLNRDYHLVFLDSFAHVSPLREEFAGMAAELSAIEQSLKDIGDREKDRARQAEFLKFQIDELKAADLREGEDEELERQRTLAASSEHLKTAAYEAYRALYGDDSPVSSSALEKLAEATEAIRKLSDLDERMKPQLDYLREVESGLDEVARDVRAYRDGVDFDPQQLEEIETRFDQLRSLKRKYGATVADMLAYLDDAEKQLADLDSSEERKAELEAARSELKTRMGKAAGKLSDTRSAAAEKLSAAVNAELAELNMSGVRFQVALEREENPDGIPLPDGKTCAFTRDGVDITEFRASTNPGEPVRPLAAIASTGEISRFMLALKTALAEADNIPVLVFDEIDIGVGGRSGEVVGKKLWGLAVRRQAVCITHLPQIAVFADAHYTVRKKESGERTTTAIEPIAGEELIGEIAVMLSGPNYSATAVKNASELMKEAVEWKKGRRKLL